MADSGVRRHMPRPPLKSNWRQHQHHLSRGLFFYSYFSFFFPYFLIPFSSYSRVFLIPLPTATSTTRNEMRDALFFYIYIYFSFLFIAIAPPSPLSSLSLASRITDARISRVCVSVPPCHFAAALLLLL